MNILQSAERTLTSLGFTPADRLLVGVSGGADSVALLLVLRELGYSLTAAHCNFGLRGKESDADQRFVAGLCLKLGTELEVKQFDVPQHRHRHGGSIEMACRELRYEWFEELRAKHNCRAVAVAHHADDQVETFLLNLLRGTGLTGLTGMQPINDNLVVRPLLGVTREEILDFLEEHAQPYRTDSTNADTAFRRNYFRHDLLPRLEQSFPDARRRILDTMTRLNATRALFEHFITDTRATLSRAKANTTLCIDRYKLSAMPMPGYVLFELLKSYGFTHTQTEQAITAATGSRFDTDRWTLWVARETLDLKPLEDEKAACHPIDLARLESLPVGLQANEGTEAFCPTMVDGLHSVAIPLEIVNKGLLLRRWQQGDRIAPFGMRGTKLVSDLLTDLHFTPAEKRAAWLVEACGTVVWIIGVRASRLLNVAPGSHEYVILKISG